MMFIYGTSKSPVANVSNSQQSGNSKQAGNKQQLQAGEIATRNVAKIAIKDVAKKTAKIAAIISLALAAASAYLAYANHEQNQQYNSLSANQRDNTKLASSVTPPPAPDSQLAPDFSLSALPEPQPQFTPPSPQ